MDSLEPWHAKICRNVQVNKEYGLNMQKYAEKYHDEQVTQLEYHDAEICKNKQNKYAKICNKICKICMSLSTYLHISHIYALPTSSLLMVTRRVEHIQVQVTST